MKTTPPPYIQKRKQPKPFQSFLVPNSVAPNASASRSCGRYAVGLRPNLDPDTNFGAPEQGPGKPK
jgi:hypothetical protein